jgi:hypothetical protein
VLCGFGLPQPSVAAIRINRNILLIHNIVKNNPLVCGIVLASHPSYYVPVLGK